MPAVHGKKVRSGFLMQGFFKTPDAGRGRTFLFGRYYRITIWKTQGVNL